MVHDPTLALIYDTRAHPLAAGIRAVVPRRRRVLFADETYDVAIEMTPTQAVGRIRLMGEVLEAGMPVSAAHVHVEGQDSSQVCATDADGQFRAIDLRRGVYDLRVEASGHTMSIPAIELA